jgi:RNA polymerase sigma-70 factor, ECF subfamily
MKPDSGEKDSLVDDERFLEIYDEYYDRIFGYILRGVHNRETAEDLTSETFFKALRRLKVADDVRSPKAWLYRIATNEILMHHRYYRKKVFVDCETEEFQSFLLLNGQTFAAADRETDVLALRQAMETLKPVERAAIEMRFFEAIDYGEMAEILGKKEVTLRSILHRSLKKLNAALTGPQP